MPTQSGSIDLNSYKMVNDNASKTATNYIQADSTGIKIANADPATATTYQHQTATKTEFVVNNKVQAEISGDGATFGNSNSTRLILDNSSMNLKDSRGYTYISLKDLRNTTTTAYNQTRSVNSENSGSVTVVFSDPISSLVSIEAKNGDDVTSNYNYSISNDKLTISNYVANTYLFVTAQLLYSTESIYSAATFGSRRSSTLGINSFTIGMRHSAKGRNVLLVGSDNDVSGEDSATIGDWLLSSSDHQLVCGTYNTDDPDQYFIVGNGTSTNRRNAFTVSKQGNAVVANDATIGHDVYVTRNARINGNLIANGYVSFAIQSLTLDTMPTLITDNYYVSQEKAFNITVAEIRWVANTAQLYMECNLKSDFNIPLTGSWNDRKIGRIAPDALRPISEVYCMSGGDLPVFIKITTGGDIIATASVVSQDRTNTNYTTYKTTRTMKISATYIIA